MQNFGASRVEIVSFIETLWHESEGCSALWYYLLNYSAPTAKPCNTVSRSCPRFMTMDL